MSEPDASAEPAGPTAPKRRGTRQEEAHRRQGPAGRLARAGPGHGSGRRLTSTATSTATSASSTSPPSSRTAPTRRRSRAQGAAQRPGHGLGHPRWRRQQHRQPDGRRRAVGHHDPAARLGGPEARVRRQHPARLPGHPSRLQDQGWRDHPRRHRRDVERRVLGRWAGVHDPAVRADHRRLHRPLRRRRLRRLRGHGRRHRRCRGVHPRGHHRPRARHQHPRRHP